MDLDELISSLPKERLKKMLRAGRQVLECQRLLGKTGANVVGQILAHQDTFYQWNHYPKGDVFDRETFGQYYYHAHRGATGEHGHFHTFMRAGGIAPGIEPALYAGEWQRPMGKDAIAHIICISMDPNGVPTALFGVNRWVTGETFYRARDVIRMIDHFRIDHTFPCLAANMWITAMLQLFYPQICVLLYQRDAAIELRQKEYPQADIYEDRQLEITSFLPISIEGQMAAMDKVLA
jgi:hypothetical protein